MSSPTFSVVIPAYDSAPFIEATIRSLSAQSWRDFEVIVVDDRSRDGTAELASQELARHGLSGRVIVRPSELRKGVSTCRHLGIGAAAGEWVAFLDSDDLFAPSKLERVARALAVAGSAVRALYHPSRRFDDTTGETIDVVGRARAGPPRDMLATLLAENVLSTCGTVVRRELLRELGRIDAPLHGVEDWWVAIRVSKRTPWAYVDEVLADIRVRPTSLMGNRPFRHYARQHAALLTVAARSGELSAEELRTLRASVLGPHTRYFAGQSYERVGWGDLLPGLLILARAGHAVTAADLLYRHVRRSVLAAAHHLYRRLRARADAPPAS